MIWNFFKRFINSDQPVKSVQNQASQSEAATFKPVTPLPSPEELCEIDPKTMNTEEIRAHLKKLYKRHNEAAASLNEELRNEAETMLDAIVECRGKYIDSQ